MVTNDTVSDRFKHAQRTLTPTQVAIGTLLALAITFVVMFMQEPMVHDSLHHFRHGVGITCM
jgi:cobalt transporter subunit CbtB